MIRLFSLIMFLLVLAAGAASARPQQPDGQVVFDDGELRIVSSLPITSEQTERLSKSYRDAYSFARRFCPLPAITPTAPITLHILNAQELSAQLPNAFAACSGPDDIWMGPPALNPNEPRFQLALAHESTHLLHKRAGARLPSFLEEGVAKTIGHRYLLMLNEPTPESRLWLKQSYKLAAMVNSEFAQQTITQVRLDKSVANHALDENTGQLYVEFLQNKVNGKGLQNVIMRINGMIAEMPRNLRKGTPQWTLAYQKAFRHHMGLTVADANNQFLRYLDQTQNDPSARLEQTIWEQNEHKRETHVGNMVGP